MAAPVSSPDLVVTRRDIVDNCSEGGDGSGLDPACDPGLGPCDPGPGPTLKGAEDSMDSYTQGIELSNACRRFYVSRVQVAEGIKARLGSNMASSGSRSLDQSMGTLRKEMASLIDQDLTLMKQLLTLNERIEELKWQRKFSSYSPASVTTSAGSANILDSDACILTDTDTGTQGAWDNTDSASLSGDRLTVPRNCESERDLLYSKYLSPSNLSLFRECVYSSTGDSLHDVPLSMSRVAMATHTKTSHDTQLRSTSDLGSSDELVSSATDIRRDFLSRYSHSDSFISVDCPSNSSSLRRAEEDCDNNNYSKARVSEKSYRAVHNSVVQTIPTIAVKVHIEEDDDDEEEGENTNKHSHDSGIQVLDHNLEMII